MCHVFIWYVCARTTTRGYHHYHSKLNILILGGGIIRNDADKDGRLKT